MTMREDMTMHEDMTEARRLPMSTPTRKQIIDAHKALHELGKWASTHYDTTGDRDHLAQVETVLMGMQPKPPLSMGDIEWDDDKHYMAEAEHHLYGLVTMIDRVGIHGYIQCAFRNDDGINTVLVNRDYLTPTGRRYTLTEVQDD